MRAGRSQRGCGLGHSIFRSISPGKSRRAPTGYCELLSGTQREALLFGAIEFVADFPDQLQEPCAYTGAKLPPLFLKIQIVPVPGPYNARWSSLPLPW